MDRNCKMLFVPTFFMVALFGDRVVTYGQDCIAPPPCECIVTALYCGGKHLSKVPVLAQGQEFHYLDFSHNDIQGIGDDSFAGLLPIDHSITIQLEYNHLTYISPGAFRGLENYDIFLHLYGNNITVLPKALVYLKHIKSLEIGRLTFFDPEVMKVIGKSLDMLSIGFDGTWPDELNLATKLSFLSVSFSNIDAFPIANKTGTFNLVREFQLHDSVVNETVDIICDMHLLERLTVINVKGPSDTPVIGPCDIPIESATTLTLMNSSVTNFSDIIRSFPFPRFINLARTGLKRVVLPSSNQIEWLDLSFNKLENLPKTEGQSPRLTNLKMTDNLLQVISAHDLTPFPNLVTLDLNTNPISRIESGAFLHNKALSHVILAETKITYIPVMPKPFDRLSLNFYGSPVQCSCAMKRMDPWPNEESVRGMCANKPMDIGEFITTELPKCQSPAVVG